MVVFFYTSTIQTFVKFATTLKCMRNQFHTQRKSSKYWAVKFEADEENKIIYMNVCTEKKATPKAQHDTFTNNDLLKKKSTGEISRTK